MTAQHDISPSVTPPAPAGPVESHRDAEYRVLMALATAMQGAAPPRNPTEALQILCDVARDITCARYAALAITDEHDRTEGFVTSGLSKRELNRLKVPPQGHGPLGSLRTDGRPVRYSDLDKADNAFGFPPKHPVMKTMLGVPIWAHKEVRGSLYVTDRNGGEPFTDDDEDLLLAVARHAGRLVERDWY